MADPFGRLAGVYEGLERLVYGDLLHRARCAYLRDLAAARHILIVGEGDGRFLVTLLKRHETCRVTVLERSARMLNRARRRLEADVPDARCRVTFWHQDATRAALPDRGYDALVTHFFLDVFGDAQLTPLVARLGACLEPGGLWLLSDFALPEGVTAGWARRRSRLLLPLMYGFFRLVTRLPATMLTPPQPSLQACSLTRLRFRPFCGGFVYAELWQRPEKDDSDDPTANRSRSNTVRHDVRRGDAQRVSHLRHHGSGQIDGRAGARRTATQKRSPAR